MGLFKISRELQFEVCNYGKPHASPRTVREECFHGEEKEFEEGYSKQTAHGLSLAESCPGRKRLLSSSCGALLSSQGVRAPPSGLLILFHWHFSVHFFLQPDFMTITIIRYFQNHQIDNFSLTEWDIRHGIEAFPPSTEFIITFKVF